MNHFVFIESNTTGTGRLAVQRLLSTGHRVTFLARDRKKYPFLDGANAGLRVYELDTNSLPSVLQAVRVLHESENVDAVLTFSEFYVPIAAEVAATLHFRGLDPKAARTCRHKPTTRETLRAAGLLTPEFEVVASEERASALARTISYPCVVKPTSDSSSHGVRMVRNPREFMAHFYDLHTWKTNVRGQTLNGEVLVESLLTGPEYSVETMTFADGATQVIGVTGKHLSQPPYFVEVGHDFPTVANTVVQELLKETVLHALAAVHFNFGPAHTEIRLTPQGPVVVEINPRLAGGMIPELINYATGTDLVDAWMQLLLGHAVDLSPKYDGCASIRFLTVRESGCVNKIYGIEEALAVPGVRDVSVSCRVGSAVNAAEDAYNRLGHVIASGNDPSTVQFALNRALTAINIDVEPVGNQVAVCT